MIEVASTQTTSKPTRFTESSDESLKDYSHPPAGFPTESPMDSATSSSKTYFTRSAAKRTLEGTDTIIQTKNGKLHKFSLKNVILILCY